MQNNGQELFEKLLGPVSPMAGMGTRNGPAPPPTASVSFADGLANENDAAACANSKGPMGGGGGFGPQLRSARAPFAERGNSFEFTRPAASLKHGAGAGLKPFTKLGAAAHSALPPPLARGDSAATTGSATPMSTSADGGPPPMPALVTPSTAGVVSGAAPTATEPLPLTPTATPLAPSQNLARAAASAAAKAAGGAQQATSGFAALLLWEDPVLTALTFVLGGAALVAAEWALAGGAPVSPTSAAAYVLLAHLGVNFLRAPFPNHWPASIIREGAWADATAERAVRAVRRVAAAHDALLSTRDPHVTLRVALSLWALAWLGATFSARALFYAAYVGAFTIPGVYAARRGVIDKRLAAVRRATLGAVDASEMPRTTRLLALAAALALLAATASWAQVAIGALVAATYWRTTLAPAEVAAIQAAAEPLTADVDRSVRRVRARLSAVLDDARAMVASTAGPASRTASRMGGAHHAKRRF